MDNCFTCVHYQPTRVTFVPELDEQSQPIPNEGTCIMDGECRVNAPTIQPLVGSEKRGVWPVIDSNQWCRNHKEALKGAISGREAMMVAARPPHVPEGTETESEAQEAMALDPPAQEGSETDGSGAQSEGQEEGQQENPEEPRI